MSRSALWWTILCTVTALAGAVGIVGWHVRPRTTSWVTDADAIRVPAGVAVTRDVRWRPPDLETALHSDAHDRDPAVPAAGRTIYFARGRAGGDSDIFYAEPDATGWAAPQPLAIVNTLADELEPAPSADGRALFFASDRPGGIGLYDLWVTRRGADGEWLPAENLGTTINSIWNDHAPAAAPDSAIIYFSSNRPRPDAVNVPGPDAWPSQIRAYAQNLDDDLYAFDAGDPLSTGPVAIESLNGTFDDTAPSVSPVGDFLYFTSNRPGGAGGYDLYRSRAVRGAWLGPERLGEGVNTSANELDPSVGLGGFGLHFASDRGEAKDYEIFVTTSREVFTETETWRAGLDAAQVWALLRPYTIALGVMLVVLLILILALRAIRHRGLSLIVRAMIGSLVVHMFMMVGFAFWSVTSGPGTGSTGQGVQAALIAPIATGELTGQMTSQLAGLDTSQYTESMSRSAADVAGVSPSDMAAAVTVSRTSLDSADAPTVQVAGRDAPIGAPPEPPQADVSADLTAFELAALAPPAHSGLPERAAAASEGEAPVVPSGTAAASRSARGSETLVAAPSGGAPRAVALSTGGSAGGSMAEASLVPREALEGALREASPARSSLGPSGGGSPVGTIGELAALPELQLPGLPEQQRSGGSEDGTGDPDDTGGLERVAAVAAADVDLPAGTGTRTLALAPTQAGLAGEAFAGGPAAASTVVRDATPRGRSAGSEMGGLARGDALGSTTTSGLPASSSLDVLNLPAMGQHVAARVQESQPGLGGGAVSAARGSWGAATGLQGGGPDARQAPAAIASSPESRPIEFADLAPAVLADSTIALLNRPSPDQALAGMDLDLGLALPRRLIPVTFQQRAESKRRDVLRKMGGDQKTEEAVARALDWLARHQSPDGHWDCTEYDDRCGSCRGMGQARADIALTGMSLLAFLAVDHTPDKPGPHQETVHRALEWLMAQQKPGGNLMGGDLESMYSQGIATIALAEAYGMTGDERYERPARRAVDFIHRAQAVRGGGWRYTPGQAGDTSVTGWQVMALSAARQANIAVPEAAFEVGTTWMNRLANPDYPGIYSYQPSYEPSVTMTAEGMFIRQLLGVPRFDVAMRASARHLVENLPNKDSPPNSYYWYYGTLALFQQQGEEWKAWNEALKPILLESQVLQGRAAGSWEIPVGDRWANVGGRVYQTAICTLTLEVYYRYLPKFLQVADGQE